MADHMATPDRAAPEGAPVGGCTCYAKAPTVPLCRDPMEHLSDCPAYGSGLPVGVMSRAVSDATPVPATTQHNCDDTLLDYLADLVDDRDVLLRVSTSPEDWRSDEPPVVVEVRHWSHPQIASPDIHETAISALRRFRREQGDAPSSAHSTPAPAPDAGAGSGEVGEVEALLDDLWRTALRHGAYGDEVATRADVDAALDRAREAVRALAARAREGDARGASGKACEREMHAALSELAHKAWARKTYADEWERVMAAFHEAVLGAEDRHHDALVTAERDAAELRARCERLEGALKTIERYVNGDYLGDQMRDIRTVATAALTGDTARAAAGGDAREASEEVMQGLEQERGKWAMERDYLTRQRDEAEAERDALQGQMAATVRVLLLMREWERNAYDFALGKYDCEGGDVYALEKILDTTRATGVSGAQGGDDA